jgi:UDP-N-acetylmuramoyl-tripeptide--D-alanyl-D-alanine ligase
MAALAVESLGPVHQTEGNLNNLVGLPLTILHAPVDAAVWVLELGMNRFGEIHRLQEICRPTVRLITNVGPAHLEGVGSIEGVAAAKGELFAGALPGDVCCINADDPRVCGIPVPAGARVLRYGRAEGAEVRLTDAAVDPKNLVTRFRVEAGEEAVLGVLRSPGLHLAHDACAAVAIAVAVHAPLEGLGRRLGRYEPVGMRLRLDEGPGGIRVINDAYNANPMSMAAALETLAALQGARRVALLGDMLELGETEAGAHQQVLALALRLGLDEIGVVGPRFSAAADALGAQVRAAADADALGRSLRGHLGAGDVVLLKGSRGMGMERVLIALGEGA